LDSCVWGATRKGTLAKGDNRGRIVVDYLWWAQTLLKKTYPNSGGEIRRKIGYTGLLSGKGQRKGEKLHSWKFEGGLLSVTSKR